MAAGLVGGVACGQLRLSSPSVPRDLFHKIEVEILEDSLNASKPSHLSLIKAESNSSRPL
jgi:hypothetical protein